MPFPGSQKPYVIRVEGVTVDGSPVTGAMITFYNDTKGTNIVKVSHESNSNISIPLSRCGDWDVGDIIHVKVEHGGRGKRSADHTTIINERLFDFGVVGITGIIKPTTCDIILSSKSTIIKSATSDLLIKKINIIKSVTCDILLSKSTIIKSATSDLLIKKIDIIKPTTCDIILFSSVIESTIKSVTCDMVLIGSPKRGIIIYL